MELEWKWNGAFMKKFRDENGMEIERKWKGKGMENV